MRKTKVLFGFGLLALSAFILGGCATIAEEQAYLTVEINPGFEFILDANDKVMFVNALNEDGELTLVDLDLPGKGIENAIEMIIDKATELGYFDLEGEANEVRIIVFGKDDEIGTRVQNKVQEKVEAVLQNRGINGNVVINEAPQEMIALAAQKGATLGKLIMAQSIQYQHPEYSVDEILEMPLDEMLAMKKEQLKEMQNLAVELKTAFHEALLPVVQEYGPQIEELKAAIEELQGSLADETNQEVIDQINAAIVAKEAELDELKDEFKVEREALRDEYLELSRPILEGKQLEYQNRINEFKSKVDQFREEHDYQGTQKP